MLLPVRYTAFFVMCLQCKLVALQLPFSAVQYVILHRHVTEMKRCKVSIITSDTLVAAVYAKWVDKKYHPKVS